MSSSPARPVGSAPPSPAASPHDGANVVVADLDGVANVADELPRAVGVIADISTEAGNVALIEHAESVFGPIDLFFANAGIGGGTDLDTPEDVWQHAFDVNVNAHRWAAKHLLPGWLARGEGYFCSTASAAGVLMQIGSAPYTLTKRAAVAFAEWLSVTYGRRGLRVSCLCPQGVNTDMLRSARDLGGGAAVVQSVGVGARTRAGRRRRGPGDRGRAVPDPPPPRGPRLHGAQGGQPGTLARRHAQAPGSFRRSAPGPCDRSAAGTVGA